MAINDFLRKYQEQGYVIFEGLLSENEIHGFRSDCDKFFEDPSKTHMTTTDFLLQPNLSRVPFLSKVVEACSLVLGKDFQILNQFAASSNLHNPQWHRDSDDQGSLEYLFDPKYQVAKCGLYLQDNDRAWGGGMEIVPRSHRPGPLGCNFPISRAHMNGKISRLQLMAMKYRNDRLPRLWLPIKAGDLFVFHANLLHRASQPDTSISRGGYKGVQLVNPPKEKHKYLVDWEISKKNEFLQVYINHQKARAARGEQLFSDSLNSKYPDGYPQSLCEEIKMSGAQVVNYSD